jgi:hypothetical protein
VAEELQAANPKPRSKVTGMNRNIFFKV